MRRISQSLGLTTLLVRSYPKSDNVRCQNAPMASATRTYGGVSAADRQADRRARLLDAGLDLLGTEGWSGATVRAICARAGLTERYFYESFADREALLIAVFDRIAEEAIGSVLEAVEEAPDDARAKARAAIAAFVSLMTDDPRKGRIAFIEAMGNEALMARRLETLGTFAGVVSEQSREFFGSEGPSPEDLDLTAHALVGALAELLIAWLGGRLEVPRERIVDHCTNLFVAAADVRSSRPALPT
jgi:AcrR family transcriptional regulator